MVAGCALTFFACACAFVVFVARFPFVAAVFGLSALGAMVASTATLDGVGAAPISTVLRGPAAVVSPAMCDGLAATVVSAGVLDEPTSGTVREALAVSIASCSGLGGTAAAATSGVERIAAGSMLGALALSTLMVGAVPAGRLSDDSVGAVAAAALALGFSIAGATSSVRATTAGPRSGRASMPEIWSGPVSSERLGDTGGLAAPKLVGFGRRRLHCQSGARGSSSSPSLRRPYACSAYRRLVLPR